MSRDQLHASLQDLALIPSPQDIEEGDLILFHALNPWWGSKQIIRAQKMYFAPEDAMWHHAAVYIGNLEVCEAQVGIGVQKVSLASYLSNNARQGHLLRVRRSPRHIGSERKVIAEKALSKLGKRYDTSTALLQGLGMWTGTRIGARARNIRKAGTCALLYSYAYFRAFHSEVTDEKFIVPAALSSTDQLVDVAVRWCRVL